MNWRANILANLISRLIIQNNGEKMNKEKAVEGWNLLHRADSNPKCGASDG
jgi:hypothetical protein